MRAGPAPLVVLDVDDLDGLAAHAAALERAGWVLHDGLDRVPIDAGRTVCRAIVRDADGAAAAVLAASWGAGLVLAAGGAPTDVREALVDDLTRIGPVTRTPPAGGSLHPEAEKLFGVLADGGTLADAARSAAISRRTADRRLAEAKRALGASSTSEAIARWLSARRPLG